MGGLACGQYRAQRKEKHRDLSDGSAVQFNFHADNILGTGDHDFRSCAHKNEVDLSSHRVYAMGVVGAAPW